MSVKQRFGGREHRRTSRLTDFVEHPELVAPQYLPNEEQLAVILDGVEAWNAWRRENMEAWPILRGANLAHRDLSNADFSNTDFARANLTGSSLRGAAAYQAEFFAADLRNADLRGADLRGAKFHNADLRGAILVDADLFRADFIGTRLDRADMAGSRCWLTTFANVHLSDSLGLEEVIHAGPSNIDTATLYNDGQSVPLPFLKKAGVPDSLLKELPDLLVANHSMQFYSCFISYSHMDRAFAERLYSRMQLAGLRVWFAAEDIKAGAKVYDQVSDAISRHDKLLLVLSANSMQSQWVITEITKARQEEVRSGRRILFPIRIVSFEEVKEWECFNADTGQDLAAEIRQYFIPDFSSWENDLAFSSAFDEILEALRASGTDSMRRRRSRTLGV